MNLILNPIENTTRATWRAERPTAEIDAAPPMPRIRDFAAWCADNGVSENPPF